MRPASRGGAASSQGSNQNSEKGRQGTKPAARHQTRSRRQAGSQLPVVAVRGRHLQPQSQPPGGGACPGRAGTVVQGLGLGGKKGGGCAGCAAHQQAKHAPGTLPAEGGTAGLPTSASMGSPLARIHQTGPAATCACGNGRSNREHLNWACGVAAAVRGAAAEREFGARGGGGHKSIGAT